MSFEWVVFGVQTSAKQSIVALANVLPPLAAKLAREVAARGAVKQ